MFEGDEGGERREACRILCVTLVTPWVCAKDTLIELCEGEALKALACRVPESTPCCSVTPPQGVVAKHLLCLEEEGTHAVAGVHGARGAGGHHTNTTTPDATTTTTTSASATSATSATRRYCHSGLR